MKEYDGHEPTWELQEHVTNDLHRIAEYGERHPAQYGGCWLQDRHVYGVSFTESVDHHTAALEPLLNLPERLRISQCSYSLAELQETAKSIVHAEVSHRPDGTLVVTGVVGVAPRAQRNIVEVYVLPEHPEVEARLRTTYGVIVSVVPGAVARAFSSHSTEG